MQFNAYTAAAQAALLDAQTFHPTFTEIDIADAWNLALIDINASPSEQTAIHHDQEGTLAEFADLIAKTKPSKSPATKLIEVMAQAMTTTLEIAQNQK